MVDLAGVGRTIFICSHQIAEVERVASHVAIMADGKLLVAEPIEELKQQFTRLNLRYEGSLPNMSGLGHVLDHSGTGRFLQLLLRDPRREAIDALRISVDVHDVEETSLSLEQIYAAMLSRPSRSARPSDLANSHPVTADEED